MEPIHWVAWGFGALIAALALSGLRDHWRGEHALFEDEPPGWWLWGTQLWRGWSRSAPAMGAGFMVMVVTLPFAFLVPEDSIAFKVLAGLCIGGIVFAVLAWVVITLFNWPAALVPPHLRAQRGVLRKRRANATRS
jgi:hypothetical protein